MYSVTFTGESGQDYTFLPVAIGESLSTMPCLYVAMKEVKDAPSNWEAIYFGETGNLRQRFRNHKKVPCMKEHGATHIGLCFDTNMVAEDKRKAAEADLLARIATPCNKD